MKRSFFQKHALFILMLVCFCIPFGLRGARLGARSMRNDVKDWLPSRFEETAQLAKFRELFVGKAGGFVMVSWDGCQGTVDDEMFRRFVNECFPEIPPSQRGSVPLVDPSTFVDEELGMFVRQLKPSDSRSEDFIGNQLSLHFNGDYFENYGGLGEKWMSGEGRSWYYILPNGDIYRWDASEAPVAGLIRQIKKAVSGKFHMEGTLVAETGPVDGPWYYDDPRRLEADLIKSVVTGPALLHDLVKEGGALEGDVETAMNRLSGVMFGPDGKQTCCIVSLNERARNSLHRIVGRGALGRSRGRVLTIGERAGLDVPQRPSPLPSFIAPLFAKQEAAVAKVGPEIRLGGPAVDNVAIDEEGQITLVRLVGFSILIGVSISWLSFRNWAIVLMLLFVGGISAIFSLSLVWWCGSTLDAVLMSMPSLVYVLGLSGAVHIANYYRDTVDEEGYPGNPAKALAHGWRPCGLAAITTALGLVSLATSDIVPIRKFGFFSALGVVFTLALLFSFLPAALSIWPPKRFETRDGEERGLSEVVTAFWRRVGLFCVRRNRIVTVVCLALMLVLAVGLPQIKTSVDLLKLFDSENKIIHDYRWLEENVGNLVPMEILLRVDPARMRSAEIGEESQAVNEDFRLNFLERMELTERVRREVEFCFGAKGANLIGTPMLASSFVPPLPPSNGGTRTTGVRGAYSRRLVEYRDDIASSGYFRVDEDGSELWRVSLRITALNDLDYGEFVHDLKHVVEPVLQAYSYRYELLQQLDSNRPERGFRGARVLTLGAPLGKSRFAGQLEAASGKVDSDKPQPTDTLVAGRQKVDQRKIFSRTLLSLMRSSSLNFRDWHDPRYALPADWMQDVQDYDCVVVVKDDPRYDLNELAMYVPVIDARRTSFDEGSLTARQKEWPISASYTGLVPIVYKAQHTLLQSLIGSTGWAFVAISIVMIMLLRNPTAGLVSMFPNVFPVVVIFGWMGWSGVMVEIGTMMTASVAMGVAVDDTIHFLTWFRRGLDKGLGRKSAIMLAYDRCATAMTQTTMIAGLGLAVFGFSTFAPTQRFGVMMLTLMLAALVGDLVFLPAILAGPAGKVFRRKDDKPDSDSDKERVTQTDKAATDTPAGVSASVAIDPLLRGHHLKQKPGNRKAWRQS